MLASHIAAFFTACRARGLSGKTMEAYQRNLHRLELFALAKGVLTVRDVDANLVREFLAQLREEPSRYHFSKSSGTNKMSPYTVHQAFRTLRTFFIWLVREEVIERNPMVKVDAPRVPKHLVPRLDLDQSARLIEAIKATALPARNLALVALMLDSGLRIGEVIGLEIDALDLEVGKAKVCGKGNKEREVPVSALACDALRNYLWVRGECASGKVFLSRSGGPLKSNAVLLVLKRVRLKLGWKKLHPHLLRHTFAKLYLAEGDLKTLQTILGHSSIETTAHFYLDPDFADLKRRHNRASPLEQIRKEKETHNILPG
jgi:site-specific recombinase XerC